MRKKMTFISIFAVLLSALFGCGSEGRVYPVGNMRDMDPSATVEALLKSVEEHDFEGISALLAPIVSEENSDLSDQFDALCEFYQGTLVSYEAFGSNVSESMEADKHIKLRRTAFAIDTTEKHYRIAMVEYLEHREEPEKEGVIAIYIGEETRFSLEGHAYWFGIFVDWQSGLHIEVIDSY